MMKKLHTIVATMVGALLMMSLSVAVSAKPVDDVGKVIFVFGTANLERGEVLPLSKGLGLQTQDKVTTGSNGRTQLRMVDKSKIALRPNSEFVVLEVAKTATGETSGAVASERDDTAVFQLLKGGLRTLTGDIGGKNPGEYKLKTPVATIGIRGTAYSVALASPTECVKAGGSAGKSKLALYVTVSDGEVYIENDAGRLDLDPSEFGCVTGLSSRPTLLLRPPQALTSEATALGGIDGGGGDSENSEQKSASTRTRPPGETTSFNNSNQSVSTETPAEFEEPVVAVTAGDTNLTGGDADAAIRSVSVVLPFQGPGVTFAERGPAGSVEVDGNGNLTQVETANGGVISVGTASIVNTGQDAASGIRWGRWTGGNAQDSFAGDSPQDIDLTNSSIHWVVGPAGADAVPVPTTGTRSFTVVGNTDPTDAAGNVGTFGSATLTADFTNAEVQSTVNFSLNNQVWASNGGLGAITGSTFDGQYANVTATDGGGNVTTGTGEFTGFFAPNADAAGLTYGLQINGGATGDNRGSGSVVFTGN